MREETDCKQQNKQGEDDPQQRFDTTHFCQMFLVVLVGDPSQPLFQPLKLVVQTLHMVGRRRDRRLLHQPRRRHGCRPVQRQRRVKLFDPIVFLLHIAPRDGEDAVRVLQLHNLRLGVELRLAAGETARRHAQT